MAVPGMYDGPAILIRIPPSRLPYLGYSRDVCKVKEGQSLVKRAPDISTSELRALLSRRCEHVVKPRQPTSDDQVEQRVLEGRPQTKPCEPESTGKKRRHAVIPDFAFQVEKLKVWVAKRSYFPWGKSQDSEERSLAHFVCRVRAARASGLLQQSQADIVEAINGWKWCAKARPRSCRVEYAPKKEESESRVRIILQRLAGQLAREPTRSGKRSLLRQYQLQYHPDKNRDNPTEVNAVFRWVQSCWDRNFRSADVVGGAGQCTTSNQACRAVPGKALRAKVLRRIRGKQNPKPA